MDVPKIIDINPQKRRSLFTEKFGNPLKGFKFNPALRNSSPLNNIFYSNRDKF